MIGPPPDAAVAAFGKRVFLMNLNNKGAGPHHRNLCRGYKCLFSGCEFNITLDLA